ncbi:MAG: amidohydrolase [Marinobacterium sp.]|nr:amidohydrolase [Marinobacterium sp.]
MVIGLYAPRVQAVPELVLYNARILVVDESFSEVEAMAIKQGKIYAIGRNHAVRALAAPSTVLLDIQGRTIIPGLIDNHIHAIRAAWRWHREVRLDGVTSYQEALQRISQQAKKIPAGEWITVIGGFVEHQFLDQPDGFRRADLDMAAPDNPVYLQHLFDWGYVNSQALARIGVDAQVPYQQRSGLLLDSTGLPSGIVTKATQRAILTALPEQQTDTGRQGVMQLQALLNQLGITSILDAGGFDTLPQYYLPFEQLAAERALTVRVHYLQQLIPWEKSFRAPPDMTRLKQGEKIAIASWYRRIGVGEQLYMPVQDSLSAAASSSLNVKKAFRYYAAQLAEKGIHLHLHAVNDHSINQHLDQFERLSERYNLRPLRWTFAHADGIQLSTIQRVEALGLNVAVHARPWLIGYRFQHQQGIEQAAMLTPMRSLTEAGLAWGLGSDSPIVASMNPFHTLDWAVNGTMVDGRPLSRQTVSRRQALVAHTRNNARLLFAENSLGTLEPGKRADLVVLDQDYLTIPTNQIRNIRPLATMVDGRWVFSAGLPELGSSSTGVLSDPPRGFYNTH